MIRRINWKSVLERRIRAHFVVRQSEVKIVHNYATTSTVAIRKMRRREINNG